VYELQVGWYYCVWERDDSPVSVVIVSLTDDTVTYREAHTPYWNALETVTVTKEVFQYVLLVTSYNYTHTRVAARQKEIDLSGIEYVE
jgi:protein tyrosine phosphatase